MKTSDSMIGGTLLPSSFTPLARYFVRFVQFLRSGGSAHICRYSPERTAQYSC